MPPPPLAQGRHPDTGRDGGDASRREQAGLPDRSSEAVINNPFFGQVSLSHQGAWRLLTRPIKPWLPPGVAEAAAKRGKETCGTRGARPFRP